MRRKQAEDALYRRFKNGDEDALMELLELSNNEFEKLYQRHVEMGGTIIEKDDYMSAMTVGFLKAINVYKDTYKLRLSFFANQYMELEIKELKTSLAPYDYDESDVLCTINNDNAITDEDVVTLLETFERITDRERMIIKYHYMDNLTFTKIAQLLGVSVTRITTLHKRTLRRLHYGTYLLRRDRRLGRV